MFHGQIQMINYYSDLKKYSGSWLYVNESDTFLLHIKIDSLQLFELTRDSSYAKPYIFGWHKFIDAGRLIENTIQYEGDIKRAVAFGYIIKDSCKSSLNLMYFDATRDAYFKVIFNCLDLQNGFATWESKRQERFGGGGKIPNKPTGQTIPSPIILKRISD